MRKVQGPSRDVLITELRRVAAAMAELHPPYTGYGPSSNYFREQMPHDWPQIQAITKRMGASTWDGVLRAAGLKVPTRGMTLEFSNVRKRAAAPWAERQPETTLLMPPGELRCYDEMPLIPRQKWGEWVRRLDDQHVLIKVVTVYEVR